MTLPLTIGITLLLFISISLSIGFHRKRRVELNGLVLFSAGFVYYWLVPLFFMVLAPKEKLEGLEAAAKMAADIRADGIAVYAVVCLLVYVSFLAGYKLIRGNGAADVKTMRGKRLYLFAFLLASTVLAVAFAYLARNLMFKGYQASIYENYQGGLVSDFLTRGPFVASVSYLFVVCFAISAAYHGKGIKEFLLSWPMIIYYCFSVLALSMGGRLYFVSNVVALILYMTRFMGYKIKAKYLIAAVLVGAGLAGTWGVIRIGGEVKLTSIIVNFFSEPLLTSMSLFAFLGDGKFPLIQFPIYLISDFANMLPSSLFPGKVAWFVNPAEHGFVVYMPAGGMHLFVSCIVNFGIVGSAAVFFALGFALKFMELRVKSVLGAVAYCCVASWMVFSFHRDPFSVSVVKNILQTSILIPALVGLILYFLPGLWKPIGNDKAAV